MSKEVCRDTITEIKAAEKQCEETKQEINNLLSGADAATLIGAYYLLVGVIYG